MFRLSNNVDLPEAPAIGVKSFWLLLITVLVTACNAFGFQLLPSLCEVGLGCTPEEVASRGQNAQSLIQQLIPIGTAIWLWLERRAPKFRLVFWRRPEKATLHFLLGFVVIGLFVFAPPAARAATQCGTSAGVEEVLKAKWGEIVVGRALAADDTPTVLYVNPKTGTWTMVIQSGGNTCVIASGSSWQPVMPVLGEPA